LPASELACASWASDCLLFAELLEPLALPELPEPLELLDPLELPDPELPELPERPPSFAKAVPPIRANAAVRASTRTVELICMLSLR